MYSALHLSAYWGYLEIVKILAGADADPTQKNKVSTFAVTYFIFSVVKDGLTPLQDVMIQAEKKHGESHSDLPAVVAFLTEVGEGVLGPKSAHKLG